MRFHHSFEVHAPLQEVADFHRHAVALTGITPPPIIVQVHRAPDPIQEGDEIEFTTWLGPLPIRWHSRIEAMSVEGFTDRQLEGPFRTWVHRHQFHPVSDTRTEVRDEIEYSPRPHLLWGPVGIGMAIGLPFLFWFRARKTRRLIETAGS
jgi:ligand-binding SRPBCC domain-containing protein